MQNSSQFELEKKQQITKLEKQNRFIEQLLSGNQTSKILEPAQIQHITRLKKSNELYLHKLQSNEFEIAIVGLEKAGKSTFANALIEADILPWAPERCTYTSTRLVYGEDKARVDFYSEFEFNSDFQKLLAEIDYPDHANVDIKKINLSDFEHYFEQLAQIDPALHRSHSGKLDQEVKEILDIRDSLLLDHESLIFNGNELTGEDFKSYITGKIVADGKRDNSRPYSVKKIEISSSNLQQLNTAIIYDVPGFDSPTKVHEKQTLERLAKADAIILVTNASNNASITAPQLNMITKNSDEDGIPLKEKFFLFGNQLDRANSLKEAENIKSNLTNDLTSLGIGNEHRAFYGSAKLHLHAKKLQNDEFTPKFEIQPGIDEIRNALIKYYENERFEILRRKIDNNRRALHSLFEQILKNQDVEIDPDYEEQQRDKIMFNSFRSNANSLVSGLEQIKNILKIEIKNESYFTNKLTKALRQGEYFSNIKEADFDLASKATDNSISLDIPIEKINHTLRDKLHKKFLREFSELVIAMTDTKSEDIDLRILRCFTSSILPENKQHLFDEIQSESEQLIIKLTSHIAHNHGRFSYLIERFSRDIFDILIAYPRFSQDRLGKFKQAEREFYALDSHYGNNGALLRVLLTGSNEEPSVQHSSMYNQVKRLIHLIEKNTAPSIIRTGLFELADAMEQSQQGNVRAINIDQLLENRQPATNKQEVINEINSDIANLREILSKAVMSAINLELAYANAIDKQIKILIDAADLSKQQDCEISNLVESFFAKVTKKIKAEELEGINSRLEELKLKKHFLKEMKELEI